MTTFLGKSDEARGQKMKLYIKIKMLPKVCIKINFYSSYLFTIKFIPTTMLSMLCEALKVSVNSNWEKLDYRPYLFSYQNQCNSTGIFIFSLPI